jgi:hypothetical protein
MPNYANGFIYKVVGNGLTYYGSTLLVWFNTDTMRDIWKMKIVPVSFATRIELSRECRRTIDETENNDV